MYWTYIHFIDPQREPKGPSSSGNSREAQDRDPEYGSERQHGEGSLLRKKELGGYSDNYVRLL